MCFISWYKGFSISSVSSPKTIIVYLVNVRNSFIYSSKTIYIVYAGELTLDSVSVNIERLVVPFSTNPILYSSKEKIVITVMDYRITSSTWSFYAYIDKPLTSYSGYLLEDAFVFKRLDDRVLVLSDMPVLVYSGSDNQGNVLLSNIMWSKEKVSLLDLSNNALEVNEEYFADIKFILEE